MAEAPSVLSEVLDDFPWPPLINFTRASSVTNRRKEKHMCGVGHSVHSDKVSHTFRILMSSMGAYRTIYIKYKSIYFQHKLVLRIDFRFKVLLPKRYSSKFIIIFYRNV